MILSLNKTIVNWRPYDTLSEKEFGINILRDIDAKNLPFDNMTFLQSLKKLIPDKLPMNHIFYSFLVIEKEDFVFDLVNYQSMMTLSLINIEGYLHGVIMSGTLAEWYRFVIELSNSDSQLLRRFANDFYQFFVNEERLESIFRDYSKQDNKDNTFSLVKFK